MIRNQTTKQNTICKGIDFRRSAQSAIPRHMYPLGLSL